MRLKELESYLEDVRPFEKPVVDLEQYPTSAHIAARLLFTGESMYGDFCDRIVADLGCGTGTLGIGAALLGALHVVGVDVHPPALELAASNADLFEDLPIDFLQSDISWWAEAGGAPLRRRSVDTVVMKPPLWNAEEGG
eukprot:jgi/Botrbrau1/6441/Bobra.0034s0017.1